MKKEQVTISLKQTAGYHTCKDTILSFEQLMISTLKDIMAIDGYIKNGRDVAYRTSLKAEKEALLEKLKASRATIIANMKTFERNLMVKSVQYFVLKITPYKVSLQKSLLRIQALTASGYATPMLTAYGKLLASQISVINLLDKVTTPEELTALLARYVYLKKEIE